MSFLNALLFTALALAPARLEEEPLDPRLALRTFDAVWETVEEEHFDPEHNGVDWDAVAAELRPRAERASDNEELRGVLREMLGRLGQSHFTLVPKESLTRKRGEVEADAEVAGGLGLDLRVRGEELWITRVEGPAAAAGVRAGWKLLTVDGAGYAELRAKSLEDQAVPREGRRALLGVTRAVLDATYGPVGSNAALELVDGDGALVELELAVDGDGALVELELERAERDVIPYSMPGVQLPPFYLRFTSRVVERADGRVGVIRFSNWFAPMKRPISRALRDMHDCDAVVIDLRGNTGGDGALVGRVAGYFLDEGVELGKQRERDRDTPYVARAERPPFEGPLAILTDETTGSSSEVFAGGMQSIGRARVFGETTTGAVLPARTRRLPNGDGLIHAIGEFRTATGDVLEGVGVRPDEEVPLRRADLLAGRDAPLEAAVAWALVER